MVPDFGEKRVLPWKRAARLPLELLVLREEDVLPSNEVSQLQLTFVFHVVVHLVLWSHIWS